MNPAENPQQNGTGAGGDNVLLDAEYLDLTYSAQRAPQSDYPSLLTAYVAKNHFSAKPDARVLDFGCGRGDFLRGFSNAGLTAVGADVSERAAEMAPEHEVAMVDPETSRLPFDDNTFDAVFSKSVIEHMPEPINLAREAQRVLKPGGVAVLMTPSWEHNAWGPFYIDHTHVTPFTAPSLADLMALAGFGDIKSTHFRQLPFLWDKPKAVELLPWAVSKIPLPYTPYRDRAPWPQSVNKFIRFSKEVMLLARGSKPA